jgi:HSP20 family protein
MANLIRRNGQQPQRDLAPPAAWDPFRVVQELMNWDPFATMLPTGGDASAFAPRFEVKETKDRYVFRADLPGVDERDIGISMTGNRLTVSGRREAEARQEEETYYAYERSFGSFSRSFTLPEGVDPERVEAELRNGVLTVTVSKRPEMQPRKISVKAVTDKVKAALGAKDKGQA